MHRCQKASHLPRRAAGPLAVAATLAATARPPTMSGQAGAPASPRAAWPPSAGMATGTPSALATLSAVSSR